MSKKITNEKFIERLNDINSDILKLIFLTKYNGYNNPMYVADEFGILKTTPQLLLSGATPGIRSAVDGHSYFMNKVKNKNPHVYNMEVIVKFTKMLTPMIFKDGYGEVKLFPTNILNGNIPSIETAIDKNSYFKNKIVGVHSNKYDYSEFNYINSRTESKIICKQHGGFYQVASDHMRGSGCPACKNSRGEQSISNILKINTIEFNREHSFDGCVNNNKLRFDFYLPNHNMCIEFDGEQHFEPVEYFGGLKKFEETCNNDKIKNKYCNDNNIHLIRIPYWEMENIEEILMKELNLKE